MDKINAAVQLKANNDVVLVHLKAMNKKYAFIVVRKGPKRMGQTTVFRTFVAMTVVGNLQEVNALPISCYGKSTPKASKPICNYP